MKIPLLATLFVFLWVLCRTMTTHTRTMQKEQEAFWKREREANQTRKKSLDNLCYITIPLDQLPTDRHEDNEIIADCISTITTLSTQKIVNLTCISNTDLKLTYGTANITVLSEYDQNYTLLVTTLQKWADTLYSLGDLSSTRTLLEYAVSIDADITKTYSLLASLYDQAGETEHIASLFQKATALSSPSGKIIVRKLQETYPFLENNA